jgi:hypothetical protein
MKILSAIAVILLAASCAAPEWASPVIDDRRFALAEQGMTPEQVRAALGPPLRSMAYPLSGNNSWEWTGYDTWGYLIEYSVTFNPQGRVVSKLARRVNVGGDRGDK